MDTSDKALVAANFLVILIAISDGSGFADVLWSYWMESVIIGAFVLIALVFNGTKPAAKAAPMKPAVMAGFFIITYVLFHTGYLMVLLAIHQLAFKLTVVIACSGIFFLSHAFSF